MTGTTSGKGTIPPDPGRTKILRLFLTLTGAIIAAESAIMLLLGMLEPITPLHAAILDIGLLTLCLIPTIYLFVYKGLANDLARQRETEDRLRSLTGTLEQQIRARTAKLASSEAEIHSILESTADGILRVDTTGVVQTANRAAHRILGYRGMDLVNKNISAIIPDDHLKVLVEGYLDFLSGWAAADSSDTITTKAVKKDGSTVEIEITIAECIIEQRIYYVLIMRDITERLKAAEAVRRSEERYRILVEHGQLIAWEMDLPTWRFTYVSPQAESMTGYPIGEWKAEGFWLAHIHPDDRIWAAEFCKTATARREDHVFEYRMLAADGRLIWLRDMVSVMLDEAGRPAGLRGFMMDITGRKRAEEQMEAAKTTAEEATKLKDKFVSLVSHDLKGPLGAMLGFLKMIERKEVERLSGESREAIAYSLEAGGKMITLIDDLLNISRLRTGVIIPQSRFIDAHYAVKKAIGHNEMLAAQKGIAVESEVPQNSRIFADETLITEVLHNLISNAVKFSRKGDRVTVFMSGGPAPTIGVADSGIGIAPHRIGTLFSYEHKKSTIGTANEVGTGLGLPLSQEIVRAHGGVLTAQSELGKGSTFFISLPYVCPRVLVVDDERVDRELLKLHLESLNVDIMEARNGSEALSLLQVEPAHLVISNVWMPIMDGLELVSQLKESKKLEQIPIIMLTADSGMDTREKALGLGADDFSTKPIDPNDLLPRIRRFIG